MKEFKGTEQAEIYASGKSSLEVFKKAHIDDFIAGYEQAIEDSKAPEMLEMLEIAKSEFGEYHFLYNAIDVLIKKATK